ncbi:MAG: copper chaperone PCu(A)C [Dermatophilaceae bacterium]
MTSRIPAALLAATVCVLLAGCGSNTDEVKASASQAGDAVSSAASKAVDAGTSAASSLTSDAGLEAGNAWARAVPDVAAMKMTGVFGNIKNTTDKDVRIVSATTDASTMTELHETVSVDGQKVMRKVDNGFTIAAGQTRDLEPGGDHIMVLQMTKPIPAGTTVTVTLRTSDGKTLEFAAPAKPFSAEQENYVTSSPSTR